MINLVYNVCKEESTCETDLLKVPMFPIMLTRWIPLKRTIAIPRKKSDTSGPKDTIIRHKQERIKLLKARVDGMVINTANEISIAAHIKPLECELVSTSKFCEFFLTNLCKACAHLENLCRRDKIWLRLS